MATMLSCLPCQITPVSIAKYNGTYWTSKFYGNIPCPDIRTKSIDIFDDGELLSADEDGLYITDGNSYAEVDLKSKGIEANDLIKVFKKYYHNYRNVREYSISFY